MIWTLYHEIGHLVGLGHNKNSNHLMFGVNNPSPSDPFDNLGFNIPNVTKYKYTTERETEIAEILKGNITEETKKEFDKEIICIQVIPKQTFFSFFIFIHLYV